MTIHETAIIDSSSNIDKDATIGPFCVIGKNVTIKAGVELKNHVTVYGPTIIDEGTVIHPGAVVGGDPQSLLYKGEETSLEIGKNCKIHECATINRGTTKEAGGINKTIIGDECLIMAYSHIAHDCILHEGVVVANCAQVAGHVIIGKKAILSGFAGVHHFVTIGERAFVGGRAGVTTDMPPFMMISGQPAEVRGVNLVGLKRDDWTEEELSTMKKVFRELYSKNDKNQPIQDLVQSIKETELFKCKKVKELFEWYDNYFNNNKKGRVLESLR